MTNVYHNLAGGNFSQAWSAGLITADDDWSGVPSIIGYTAFDVTSATGVDPRTVLTDTGFVVDVVANRAPTATNGGVLDVDSTIADPTIGLAGSNSGDYAAIVIHLNATGRQNIRFQANVRDLDASVDNAIQPVNVQYRVGTSGDWTNVTNGYFADVTTASTATQVTAIDVTLPADANGQSQVQVRVLTTNAAGNDELIGIDDIQVSSSAAGGGATASISIDDVSISEGDAGTQVMTFTVTRSNNTTAFDVDFASADGTATAGSDYVATSGTLNFTAGGALTQTVSVTINGDTTVEATEAFTLALSNIVNTTGTTTISDASGTGTITNDDISVIKISAIQGPSFFSPILAGDGITAYNTASTTQVTVKAVVTAVDSFNGSDGVTGFYLMEEEADWDGNANTSEGIFVRTSNLTGITVGETVTVTANVMEFQNFSNLPRTFLVNPTVTQDNNNVALPTLVLDGTAGKAIPNKVLSDDNPDFKNATGIGGGFDPQNDALDFYETIEGSRVTITNMVVADGFVGGSNDNFIFFNAYSTDHADASRINVRGGYTITGDPQFYPVDTADPLDNVNNGGRNNTDGVVNPDILELDFGNTGRGGTSGFDQHLTMGDSLGDVTGIIDFDFGVTKLYVTDALDADKVAALADNTPIQEVTTLTADPRSLRVATFNVENLSPVGTTFSTNNGVEITTQAKFDKLAANIANNLLSPDILIVQEVQDNNGVTADSTVDASTTWGQLVAAVNAATGKTYQWVDEAPLVSGSVGGAPGGNIRVGFLYDTARVQLGDLAADASLADRRKFTDRIGDGVRDAGDLISVDDTGLGINPADWNGTRRSIVGEFNFNGQTVHVFGSHLPSKGGSDDFFELDQNNASGVPANGAWASRNTLAQQLWSVQDKASQSGSLVVSGGDYNEFWFYRPLEVATGYATADGQARVGGTRYSNLMVDKLAPAERFSYDFDGRSQALDTLLADQTLAGVAQFDVVHINTGYNDRTGAVNPASSDHDPSLARFDFRSLGERLVGTAAAELIEGLGGNDTLLGGAGADTLDGGDGIDTASYADSAAGVAVNLGTGRGSAGDADGDRLFGIENLVGSAFDDRLQGDAGDNRLAGGAGNDVLIGARGQDTLVAGAGTDVLQGGVDADTFLFGQVADGAVTVITDFSVAAGDLISLGTGIEVSAAVGFVTTGATVNGVAVGNGARALDLVLTLSADGATQTVHVLDAYNFASNSAWEAMLGLDLSYARPTGSDLIAL